MLYNDCIMIAKCVFYIHILCEWGAGMIIGHLEDYSAYREIVATWIYDEFIKGIKHDVSYERILSGVSISSKNGLPVRLVAIEGDRCVGTVTLTRNDLRHRDYTPWLAALYVDEAHRGKKIAERLIDRVKDVCLELGYDELYLRTEKAGGYYRKRGWQFVESCEDDYGLVPDVFKFPLKT